VRIPCNDGNAVEFQWKVTKNSENGNHVREADIDRFLMEDADYKAIELPGTPRLTKLLFLPHGVDPNIFRELYSTEAHGDDMDRVDLVRYCSNPGARKSKNRIIEVGG